MMIGNEFEQIKCIELILIKLETSSLTKIINYIINRKNIE